MQLINVIPVARNIGMESLTYFSSKPLKEGSVVFVPLRKKEVPAIVLSSQDITDVKTQIRSADFALKKIENKKTQMLLLPEFVTAARKRRTTSPQLQVAYSTLQCQMLSGIILEKQKHQILTKA